MVKKENRFDRNKEYNRQRAREYYRSKHPAKGKRKEFPKVLHSYTYKSCEARQLFDEAIAKKL